MRIIQDGKFIGFMLMLRPVNFNIILDCILDLLMNRQYMKWKNIVHDLECIRISWIIYSHRAEQER